MPRLFISLEVTKMNWHRVGKNVRKATDDLSTKAFGIMKTLKSPYRKVLRGTELVENVHTHAQNEKILRELEFARARAFEVVRRLQNC
jgi:type I site-specific restriction endonuclease